jgi:hypothetical protein
MFGNSAHVAMASHMVVLIDKINNCTSLWDTDYFEILNVYAAST